MAEKRAWVKYHERNGEPGIAIMVNAKRDWLMESWWPCVAMKNGHTDFIHWGIFQRLAHIQNLGYSIEFD